MTSPTGKTKVRRALRKSQMGNKRKNALARTGTTPRTFELNKPVAAETTKKAAPAKAPAAAKPAPAKAPAKAAAPKAKAAPKEAKTETKTPAAKKK